MRDRASIANLRHAALVEQARTCVARARAAAAAGLPEELVLADLHEARAGFDEVTGARPQDEVLQTIFSRFCIGNNSSPKCRIIDVIVIGAGHAGVEAAWAAARMGRDVAICTLTLDTVAHMPCNPAIGGTAKGHLVREIDALGGLMGTAIDATAIQFKLLNRSRGPAVWSPRAQADKRVYSEWVRAALEREPEISWIVGRAGRILVDGRPGHRARARGRRHLSLRRAGRDDGNVPQRPGSRRARAAARRAAPGSRRRATSRSRSSRSASPGAG